MRQLRGNRGRLLRRQRHDFASPRRVRREHAVVATEMMPRRRHQRRQPPEELGRLQHEHLPVVGDWPLETVAEAAVGQLRQARQRQRRPRSVAQQPLEALAIVGVEVHASVQGEAFEEGGVPLAARRILRRSNWDEQRFRLRARQRVGLLIAHRFGSRAQQAEQAHDDPAEDGFHLLVAWRSERHKADCALLAHGLAVEDRGALRLRGCAIGGGGRHLVGDGVPAEALRAVSQIESWRQTLRFEK